MSQVSASVHPPFQPREYNTHLHVPNSSHLSSFIRHTQLTNFFVVEYSGHSSEGQRRGMRIFYSQILLQHLSSVERVISHLFSFRPQRNLFSPERRKSEVIVILSISFAYLEDVRFWEVTQCTEKNSLLDNWTWMPSTISSFYLFCASRNTSSTTSTSYSYN